MSDLTISGAPLWPLAPNWREPFNVAYEFKTDIFTSRSQKEQRRAQRTTPRKVMKFAITRTNDEARTFSRFLTKYQGPAVALADSSRFARMTGGVESGATVLPVDDASAGWLSPAESVVLFFGGDYVPAQVQSSDAEARTVTLVAPVSRDWPIGTKVHSAARGRFDDTISLKNYTDRTVDADMTFVVEPAQVRADDVGEPQDVFNGREVFTLAPNFDKAVQGEFQRTIDVVDFARGRTQSYLPVAFSTRTKQFQMLLPDRAARAETVGLFLRMKGRRGEFYMPSFEDDFTAAASAAAGTLTATFAGTDLDAVYHADDVHRAIVLSTVDGARFYRRITASSNNGSTTTLSTDVAWPVQIDATVQINWLVVHRFAVDQLALDCRTDEVAQTQLSVLSLEDLPVSDTDAVFSDLDGAAQWVLDNWGMPFFEGYIAGPVDYLVNWAYPYASQTIGPAAIDGTAPQIADALASYDNATRDFA